MPQGGGYAAEASQEGGGLTPAQAAAGGNAIGDILSFGFKMAQQRRQKKYAKKIAKIEAQLREAQHVDQLKNFSEAEGDLVRAGDEGNVDLSADLAERGLGSSSIKNEEVGDFNYQQSRRLDALRRQRTLVIHGKQAADRILNLQGRAQKSAERYQIAIDVANMVGGVAGMAGGMALSDPKLKENREPVDTKAALKEIVKTPVEAWNYKADKMNPRVGPMADKVHENSPDASDGHSIDLVTLNGKLQASIQELTKRIQDLEGRK